MIVKFDRDSLYHLITHFLWHGCVWSQVGHQAWNMACLHFQHDLKVPKENHNFLNSHFLPVADWFKIHIGIISHPGFSYAFTLPLSRRKTTNAGWQWQGTQELSSNASGNGDLSWEFGHHFTKKGSFLQKQTCQKAASVTAGSPAWPETWADPPCQIAQ